LLMDCGERKLGLEGGPPLVPVGGVVGAKRIEAAAASASRF
jgi:hypothetical protein